MFKPPAFPLDLPPLSRLPPFPPFRPVPGWKFETTHPYANNLSISSMLFLPGGGSEMYLKTIGEFSLEYNYDFLRVSCHTNNTWTMTKTYTGEVGPTINDVFVGNQFKLMFDSEVSVTRYGFCLVALYR